MLRRTHTGSPVGETVVNAVARKLLRAGSGEDKVSLETGIDNLDDDLLVREADDQAVLRGVVLVLRLGDQALAGIVCKSCIFVSDFSS